MAATQGSESDGRWGVATGNIDDTFFRHRACNLAHRAGPAGRHRKRSTRGHLLSPQSDIFLQERIAGEALARLEAERSGIAHSAHQLVTRVSWGGQLRGHRSRRGAVERGRRLIVKCRMRRFGLSSRQTRWKRACWTRWWRSGGRAASAVRGRCMRSCAPFCSGRPRRGWRLPSVIHHPESLRRPQKAGVANGAPWSVRIATGRPYS